MLNSPQRIYRFVRNDESRTTNLRSVPHFLQFLNHRLDTAGTDEQNAIGQSANNVLSQFLASQQLLGQDGVLSLHQANAAMQLHRDASARSGANEIIQHGLILPIDDCRLMIDD
jgi:hypothetical protein